MDDIRSNERFLLIVRRLLVVQILRKSKVGYFALPAMPRNNKFKRRKKAEKNSPARHVSKTQTDQKKSAG